MHDKKIFDMFKARYNQVRRSSAALSSLMAELPDRDVTGFDLADLLDEVEAITQAFHEANAYHNAMLTVEPKEDNT